MKFLCLNRNLFSWLVIEARSWWSEVNNKILIIDVNIDSRHNIVLYVNSLIFPQVFTNNTIDLYNIAFDSTFYC